MKEFLQNNLNPNEILKSNASSLLKVPERINNTESITKDLGDFLIDNGYIKGIEKWNSWGFKYEFDSKKIFLAGINMPDTAYEYYIFRLGKNEDNEESLFPKNNIEVDNYRFIHETSHAYQNYLMNKESTEGNFSSLDWYNKAYKGELDSTFALLFSTCLKVRQADLNKGLSTWGNVPDYTTDNKLNEAAMRGVEDANELINMYLWHPKYSETFLNYLALKIPGFNEQNLSEDRLVKISENTKSILQDLISLYVEEMKLNIKA